MNKPNKIAVVLLAVLAALFSFTAVRAMVVGEDDYSEDVPRAAASPMGLRMRVTSDRFGLPHPTDEPMKTVMPRPTDSIRTVVPRPTETIQNAPQPDANSAGLPMQIQDEHRRR